MERKEVKGKRFKRKGGKSDFPCSFGGEKKIVREGASETETRKAHSAARGRGDKDSGVEGKLGEGSRLKNRLKELGSGVL